MLALQLVDALDGLLVTSRNEDFALALVDGAFTKALEVHLVRKVLLPVPLRVGSAAKSGQSHLRDRGVGNIGCICSHGRGSSCQASLVSWVLRHRGSHCLWVRIINLHAVR